MKPDKAGGPDIISLRVLEELAEVLSVPLVKVFQTPISTSQVLSHWKEALVTPIFKKGDKYTAANCHSVSLTAICSKICEHIIAKSIMEHLESNDLVRDLRCST